MIAGQALELNDACKKLPEKVAPWDLFRSQTKNKFVEFKGLVGHVR